MDSAVGHLASPRWGCPIRTSPDHSLLAAPRGFSQPSTSFIGSWCQGIHRAPLLARRLDLSTTPNRQDQRSHKKTYCLLNDCPLSSPANAAPNFDDLTTRVIELLAISASFRAASTCRQAHVHVSELSSYLSAQL